VVRKRSRVPIRDTPIDALASEEFRLLQIKFSSGVTLKELRSVAAIIVMFGQVTPPGRNAKRHFPEMVKWFVNNWTQISPWLSFITLRDQNLPIIDGHREGIEKGFIPI
jgi:hypothetical protein